ncbi:hypothetical protein ORI20_14135 [Mycobacterium sp. CVI_P3]|uniref:PPE family protein n=1 Tax=Mycobacterium pinniadriaticum TaxID=2994102 RepID=A0ABT3SEB1_9MYCO|nr:hypothetical protein [Mycobacterium pinniadriaticum]MCX2931420.1 hypothetical protein [Mycobacterium pinniadriaticum]MCX2937844.1 hypothetical protein [Mycobacterium pinniadriaticum]
MAVFSAGVGGGDLADWAINGFSLDNAVGWNHPLSGSDIAVLGALSYAVNTTTLASLTRAMKCDGVTMDSLGVVAWNDLSGGGWTEVFGLVGVPEGTPRITASVEGAGTSQRVIRGSSVAYTGVEGIGDVTTAFDTGTALAVAGDASAASMIAAFFGTRSGLSNANETQRYLQNTSTSLLISEARGTGSSFDFTASRALSGPWSAITVVLNPSSSVASVQPIVVAPRITAELGRVPRPTGPRRVIFDVEPED